LIQLLLIIIIIISLSFAALLQSLYSRWLCYSCWRLCHGVGMAFSCISWACVSVCLVYAV